MKLKKLEIIGFKSFLDKVTIYFPPGVSAVVGPNGCGKSNIVDALRWVMGEQSVKQLRGKDKEDIIFAGASGKAPTNLAEVSITLLNDNGNAPEAFKDYSEIQVTRRLYRSGESAYLINKQPCRLKDIHHIFIGSGMGARTYSVIGQGNIGAITDAGPDQRRVFVEEAAGVTRYKARKTETLSKIKRTNQNLLRVNDIVSEVERQMQGLKRQARKAKRYKNHQTQIKYFDSRLLCHYFDELSGQISRSDTLLRRLQDSELGYNNQIKKLDAAVAEIKLKRWEMDQEISSQKSKKFELQRKADRAETELSHFKGDVDRLDQEIDELTDTREELELKNQRIETDVAQIKDKVRHLKNEIVSIDTRLETDTKESTDLQAELTRQNRYLEGYKNELMQMVAEEARCQNSLQTAAKSKDGLTRRLRRMDEEAVTAAQKKEHLTQKLAAGQKELAQIKAEISDYDHQITLLQNQLDQSRREFTTQAKITRTLEQAHHKVRSKLSAVKKMAENYDWFKDGVKAIMRARQHQPIAGEPETAARSNATSLPLPPSVLSADILGLTADILETSREYQIALDAVLGDALQYIIVKDQQDVKTAIEYLKATQTGRSGFIPMAQMITNPPLTSSRFDPEKYLLHHVQVKPGFEAVAKALLGHVLIAQSIDEALNIAKNTFPRPTIVTLAGELVSPLGIIIGGSQNKLSGILAKKQELKDLQTQAKSSAQKLETAQKNLAQLEAELNEQEKNLQEITLQKTDTTQIKTDTEKEIYALTENLKHAQRHLNIVRLEQDQLIGDKSELSTEMETQTHRLTRITESVRRIQANITQTSQQINQVSDRLTAFNQNTVDRKLNRTSLQADLNNSRNTLNRLSEFHSDGIQRYEQLHREMIRKREKREELKQKQTQNQVFLGTVYKEIEVLDQALSDTESKAQAIDAILKENDDKIAKIHAEREKTLKKIRLQELERSEKKVKRENIETRCEERYHIEISTLRQTIHAAEQPDGEIAAMQVSQMEAELARHKARLAAIGDVNMGAIEEYRLLKERYDFLTEQRDDLVAAIEDLRKVIRRINKITQERFLNTFTAVNDQLKVVFPKLFEGGSAWLELTDPKNLLESGVEYMVQPAGKKLTRMSLLSGGEKALSAIAFIFSIFLLKPAAFCLMDEIDAPLDDANIFRFNQLLKVIGQNSQIVMITHNKRSMEFADTLFGITMEQKGISKVVSVNLQNN